MGIGRLGAWRVYRRAAIWYMPIRLRRPTAKEYSRTHQSAVLACSLLGGRVTC